MMNAGTFIKRGGAKLNRLIIHEIKKAGEVKPSTAGFLIAISLLREGQEGIQKTLSPDKRQNYRLDRWERGLKVRAPVE